MRDALSLSGSVVVRPIFVEIGPLGVNSKHRLLVALFDLFPPNDKFEAPSGKRGSYIGPLYAPLRYLTTVCLLLQFPPPIFSPPRLKVCVVTFPRVGFCSRRPFRLETLPPQAFRITPLSPSYFYVEPSLFCSAPPGHPYPLDYCFFLFLNCFPF